MLENCVRRNTSLGLASLWSGGRMTRRCSAVNNDFDRIRQRAQQETYGGSEVLRRSTPAAATLALMVLVLVLVPGESGLDQARAHEATQGAPQLQARSWVLTDADTGLYLAGK